MNVLAMNAAALGSGVCLFFTIKKKEKNFFHAVALACWEVCEAQQGIHHFVTVLLRGRPRGNEREENSRVVSRLQKLPQH